MKRSSDLLSRHQVILYRGDWEKLQTLHPNNATTEIIRTLVRRHIQRVEQEMADKELANV